MSETKLSVIIVNYRSGRVIMNCLDSIMRQHGVAFEVLVVDNASNDGSVEKIEAAFPQVCIIRNSENRGYAAANNQGLKAAAGEYILVLNPDTVVEENVFRDLIIFLENNPDAGAVCPKLVYPDGELQLSARTFYTLRTIVLRRTFLGRIWKNSRLLNCHLMVEWDHASVREIDWALGACIMTRKALVGSIGLFDEKYKLYFEDVDLCWRIRKIGKKVYYYPFVTVVHHHQRDSAKGFTKKTLWHITSALRFFNKYGWRF